jgi:uncharacterized protein involved in exopolysaccharide biosynthesis
MPPEKNDSQGLLGLVSNLPISGIGFGMDLNQQSYTYLAILNSRTVAVKVVEKFDLMNRFQVKTLHEALDQLKHMKIAEIRDDGLISLYVSVKTNYLSSDEEEENARNLAADMANYFIDKLNEINISMQVSQARHNRIFIEERYNQNKLDLIEAETNLKKFQEKYNAISLPDQLQAAIKTAAEINAQIIVAQVELGALESITNEDHPEVKKNKMKIRELETALRSLQIGENLEESSSELFPAFSQAPELGVLLVRLTREMETQNAIYKFLTQQYEQAKIQEARDTPTIQVLDHAVPPEFRSKPHRSLMVIIGGFVSILLSVLIIVLIEFTTKVDQEKSNTTEKYHFIITNLKNDFNNLLFWKRS